MGANVKEISCVIPGASNPDQLNINLKALELSPLSDDEMHQVKLVYDEKIKPLVHQLW
jgi:aryl-alcohol dehydrogenase-like predicted oxidoreductase